MKYLLFFFLTIIFIACKADVEKDKQAPNLIITAPVDGETVTPGSRVAITGTITDESNIVELHVHITNLKTGVLLIDIHRMPAAPSYSIEESFTASDDTDYHIQLIAKDARGNEARASVTVKG